MSHPITKLNKSLKRGFTLLEILLVVGIIAVLAGIVIIAINPAKQLATVRNTERRSDLKQINNAMQQYYIDNASYPAAIPSSLTEICNTGILASSSVTVNNTSCGSLVNLSRLVPLYITAIPVDPQGAVAFLEKVLPIAYANANGTGYNIMKDSTNKLVITTERQELGVVIAIGTTTAATSTPVVVATTTYNITYNGNNNTSGTAPVDNTDYESGDTVTVLGQGSLLNTSHTFAGWNTLANDSGDDYSSSSPLTITSDVTLYAQWADVIPDTYTVSFDTSEGSANPSDITGVASGATVTLPSEPTKTGNTFVGWFTPMNASFTDATAVTIDITVHAHWTVNNYTVTFDAGDGTGSGDQSFVYNVAQNLESTTTNSIARNGYTFSGWATSLGGAVAYANQESYTIGAGDVTLWAVWEAVVVANTCGTGDTAGMVGYWPMDGNANDVYTSHFNGALYGGISTVSGQVSSAISQGLTQGDYFGVSDNDALDLSGNFTISAWTKIRATGYNSNPRLFLSKFNANNPEPGYMMWFESGGGYANQLTLWVNAGASRLMTGIEMPTESWTSVIWTHNISSAPYDVLYINGVAQYTNNSVNLGDAHVNTEKLSIGYCNWGANLNLNGEVDELALFNSALSPANVSAIYTNSNNHNSYCSY